MTSLSSVAARISERVSGYQPRRALIAVLTFPLFLIGFTVGLIFKILWVIGVYLFAAAAVGFEAAYGRRRSEG